MTNQHTINPPPELVRQWYLGAKAYPPDPIVKVAGWWVPDVAAQAAQWGADQELEACVKWIEDCGYHPSVPEDFRTARRPKPLSLKEKALKALKVLPTPEGQVTLDITDLNTIRRALETIND
jgi:hypothetical protein